MELGIVVIGRNEGARLAECLCSVCNATKNIVYVDSGSTDNSLAVAASKGITTIQLDLASPFTAGRARNEGARHLLEKRPSVELIQFIDGDCQLVTDWLRIAVEFMSRHPIAAIVCGRLREKYPQRSIYNALCDMEWDLPPGETKSCGGIAMLRADAFRAVGGFRPDLIAGEEPELCLRLRQDGWQIWRLPNDMATHDAALLRFGQWWKRAFRAGHCFAEGVALHGRSTERHYVREWRSAWLWGLGIPVVVLVALIALGPWGALLLLIYPLQVVRLAVRGRFSPRENWLHGGFLVLAKFPEMLGQMRYLLRRSLHRPVRLIEYK